MSDPTGSGARNREHRKAIRRARLQENNAVVNQANEALSTAREVLGPKHPTVTKLVADSVDAVEQRSEAVKKYKRGE